jgi:hypothetical protein
VLLVLLPLIAHRVGARPDQSHLRAKARLKYRSATVSRHPKLRGRSQRKHSSRHRILKIGDACTQSQWVAAFGQRQWSSRKVNVAARLWSDPLLPITGRSRWMMQNNTVTYKIEHAGSPLQNGTTRVQKVIFDSDTLTWTGSELRLPRGVITPINVWKKAE